MGGYRKKRKLLWVATKAVLVMLQGYASSTPERDYLSCHLYGRTILRMKTATHRRGSKCIDPRRGIVDPGGGTAMPAAISVVEIGARDHYVHGRGRVGRAHELEAEVKSEQGPEQSRS